MFSERMSCPAAHRADARLGKQERDGLSSEERLPADSASGGPDRVWGGPVRGGDGEDKWVRTLLNL